ncbi:site-specific integrase [Prochlorococcus marinus]|uniref:Integrase n=1 Tax=Prochlorococcus marinus XMU1408 TaxID=2213228 RepID=A0A318R9M1_PROMR|nr:site-specific integrase [Prochlorococcus marinus]MBW3041551.1 integrase [Prochlorococcus marinus str. XMU1408]PYE02709.1 integrase [Prochlorococcus marinus XMU1408]
MDANQKLLDINQDLESKGITLKIEKRGKVLNIRGSLPDKKSPNLSKVQRVSLKLPFDINGLEEAKKAIELIDFQLKKNQFSWSHWIKEKTISSTKSNNQNIVNEIESFKKKFFSDTSKSKSPAGMISTWQSAYKPYMNRIIGVSNQSNLKLGEGLLMKILLSYKENSRSRQQCGIALSALARHLNLELPENWKQLQSGYGIHESNFRELPSDDEIINSFHLIPNPKWRFVFGLMATYGLRNHEVFFSDLSCLKKDADKILRVFPNTKTGEHQVWPFHPEWVSLFELDNITNTSDLLPNIKTDLKDTTLQHIGRRVSEQFRRYKISFTPYDLRHAWAVRTILIGLPNTVAAKMMGHSVSIHTKTYHHWITKRDQQLAVDSALSRVKY